MTRRQYVDILQAETAGGNITDEVRIDYRLMGALLDIAREKAITTYAVQKKVIPAMLYQTTYLVFNSDFQEDNCNTLFAFPSKTIQTDGAFSGIGYVGSEDGKTPYIRSATQVDFANQMQHYLMYAISVKNPVCIYMPEFNLLKINKTPGQLPKRIMVTGVFTNPTLIPEYNEQFDDYPITMEIFTLAKDYLLQTDLRQMLSLLPDEISNSSDDSSVAAQAPRK
jgi:hypothetical protein